MAAIVNNFGQELGTPTGKFSLGFFCGTVFTGSISARWEWLCWSVTWRRKAWPRIRVGGIGVRSIGWREETSSGSLAMLTEPFSGENVSNRWQSVGRLRCWDVMNMRGVG